MKLRHRLSRWWRHWLCRHFGHLWTEVGGRQCPYGEPKCSQPVFVCPRCGGWDHGEPGGPGHAECQGCHWRWEHTDA